MLARFAPYWSHFRFDDIISSRHHSDDFKETRAEYVSVRLRFMALFFAVSVPLWIPIDFLTIKPEHFAPMAIARCLLSGVLLAIAILTLRKCSGRQTHALLALSMIAPSLFYVAAISILNLEVAEVPSAGYSFMPFVMVAILGLFPITLVCGVLLEAIILTCYLGVTAALGNLISVDTFNKLWLFFMFAGASLWIQSGQLLMLLKLYRESTTDPLTGLINRRVMMKRLAAEIIHHQERQEPFCVLMFDLDRFKRINDNHGHLIGDQVLKVTAQILREGLREDDIVARFGGEEFVAVLPNLDSRGAIAVAERIRERCFATTVTAPNGESIQLSTSVGVTQYETGEAIETTLSRVDDCLYQAKDQGRNRVVHSNSAPALVGKAAGYASRLANAGS